MRNAKYISCLLWIILIFVLLFTIAFELQLQTTVIIGSNIPAYILAYRLKKRGTKYRWILPRGRENLPYEVFNKFNETERKKICNDYLIGSELNYIFKEIENGLVPIFPNIDSYEEWNLKDIKCIDGKLSIIDFSGKKIYARNIYWTDVDPRLILQLTQSNSLEVFLSPELHKKEQNSKLNNDEQNLKLNNDEQNLKLNNDEQDKNLSNGELENVELFIKGYGCYLNTKREGTFKIIYGEIPLCKIPYGVTMLLPRFHKNSYRDIIIQSWFMQL